MSKKLIIAAVHTDTARQVQRMIDLHTDTAEIFLCLLGTQNDKTVFLPPGLTEVVSLPEVSETPTQPELYAKALAIYSRTLKADMMILPADKQTHHLGNLLAEQLGFPFYPEVTSIKPIDADTYAICRKVYGSNLNAEFFAVRPFAVSVYPSKLPEIGSLISYDVKPAGLLAPRPDWLLSFTERAKSVKNGLETTRILFIAGRGISSAENYKRLERLAFRCGAMVGATRAVVLAGWAPLESLVGQSGLITSPEVCITFGVSGSAPFLAGIQQASHIIAVNNDTSAAIFQAAHDGIVADCEQILCALEQQFMQQEGE